MLMLIPLPVIEYSRGFHFNTSHVNVNHYINHHANTYYMHFNTSHVNVNLCLMLISYIVIIDFNTSHVNVNPVVEVSIKLVV